MCVGVIDCDNFSIAILTDEMRKNGLHFLYIPARKPFWHIYNCSFECGNLFKKAYADAGRKILIDGLTTGLFTAPKSKLIDS